jgi:hypothetical protein
LLRSLVTPPVDDQLLRQAQREPQGVVWTLWKATQEIRQQSESPPARLTIDRISLTADTRSERILREIAVQLGRRGGSDRYYDERFALPGLTLQLGPKSPKRAGHRVVVKRRFARVDLNRSELRHPRSSLRVFDALDLSSARLTRVDVAVDIEIDPRSVHVVPSNKRKVRASWYWGARGLETLYLFAQPRQIRVYDKRAERKRGPECVRFEAEERDLRAQRQLHLASDDN